MIVEWLGFRKFVGVATLVGTVIGTIAVPYRPVVFVGHSMEPTYSNLSFATTAPFDGVLDKGDVVIVDRPDGRIIKRVALLPGDKLFQFWDGNRWTDLQLATGPKYRGPLVRTVPIPEGYVYVLGDNRNSSVDSRCFGPVPLSQIERKVVDAKPLPDDLKLL